MHDIARYKWQKLKSRHWNPVVLSTPDASGEKGSMTISKIQQVMDEQVNLEIAVLVGSQTEGRALPESDWDIAIQWTREITMCDSLVNTETLRRNLAKALRIGENLVDLIDLPRAGLTMRAMVAEEGIPLKGEDSLPWNHFLGRTWRELEAFEWERQHGT